MAVVPWGWLVGWLVGWLAGAEMEMDAESEEVDGLNEETASALRQN